MPRYHIWTIGCQMNKAESERLGDFFERQGYQATAVADEADIIVLNSCVVRQSAENRVVNKLHSLKSLKQQRPHLTLAVTGCWVDSNIGQLSKGFPHVDHFFGPGERPYWLEGDWDRVVPASAAPTAYVSIIQGCDNFCSYCIVPYRRGREKSRPVDDIINEVRERVNSGTREVTLLGQNVDSYGHDLPDRPDLASLLAELNAIEGLARIRFLTNHPKDMSPRLITSMASLDKVCEQLSLPVQSGSNGILKAMKRGYTVEGYRQLVEEIRRQVPGVALSTDVIVGFPSETEQQFMETYDLLAELRFDTVHVAAYSPRPGTAAAREFEDNVPATEKKRRLDMVEKLQKSTATEINAGLLGRTMEVLVEGRKGGKWQGRTRSDKLVFFNDRENRRGQLLPVRIEQASPWSLQGRPEIK
jgi:tRNA-2-methylthio-N6-dimethylallyladenosine synthase